MRRVILHACLAAAFALAVVPTATADDKPGKAEGQLAEIRQLQMSLDQLKKQVAELEAKRGKGDYAESNAARQKVLQQKVEQTLKAAQAQRKPGSGTKKPEGGLQFEFHVAPEGKGRTPEAKTGQGFHIEFVENKTGEKAEMKGEGKEEPRQGGGLPNPFKAPPGGTWNPPNPGQGFGPPQWGNPPSWPASPRSRRHRGRRA